MAPPAMPTSPWRRTSRSASPASALQPSEGPSGPSPSFGARRPTDAAGWCGSCAGTPRRSESTLSKQLKELVDDGFLTRTDFSEVPPRVEYTLTPQGESFVPILLAMKQWGEEELGL